MSKTKEESSKIYSTKTPEDRMLYYWMNQSIEVKLAD
jgi:hypothetical protein